MVNDMKCQWSGRWPRTKPAKDEGGYLYRARHKGRVGGKENFYETSGLFNLLKSAWGCHETCPTITWIMATIFTIIVHQFKCSYFIKMRTPLDTQSETDRVSWKSSVALSFGDISLATNLRWWSQLAAWSTLQNLEQPWQFINYFMWQYE